MPATSSRRTRCSRSPTRCSAIRNGRRSIPTKTGSTCRACVDQPAFQARLQYRPDAQPALCRRARSAVRRELFAAIGGFDPRWDGTEEYDLALRLAERLGARRLRPCRRRALSPAVVNSGRTRRPVEAICADMPAIVQAHLDRLGIAATVEQGNPAHTCRVRYRHDGPDPLVSIIVPTKNQLGDAEALRRDRAQGHRVRELRDHHRRQRQRRGRCLRLSRQAIEDKFDEIGSRIRVLRHPGAFNYSAMNNRAVRESAQGEYLCLLNNDTAPLDGAWLGEMMALARRPEVGAVGAKLYLPRRPHPAWRRDPRRRLGFAGRPPLQPRARQFARLLGPAAGAAQDFSAVTAACLVTRRVGLGRGRRARRDRFRRLLQRCRLLPEAARGRAPRRMDAVRALAARGERQSPARRCREEGGRRQERAFRAREAGDVPADGCRGSPSTRPTTATCRRWGSASQSRPRARRPGIPISGRASGCWSTAPTATAAASTASSRRAAPCSNPAMSILHQTMRLLTAARSRAHGARQHRLPAPARIGADRGHRAGQADQRRIPRLRDGRSDHQPAAAERRIAPISRPISATG